MGQSIGNPTYTNSVHLNLFNVAGSKVQNSIMSFYRSDGVLGRLNIFLKCWEVFMISIPFYWYHDHLSLYFFCFCLWLIIFTQSMKTKKMNKKVYKNIKISTCITLIKKCVQDINIWRCIYSLLQINKN